jgi:hypothetical protein
MRSFLGFQVPGVLAGLQAQTPGPSSGLCGFQNIQNLGAVIGRLDILKHSHDLSAFIDQEGRPQAHLRSSRPINFLGPHTSILIGCLMLLIGQQA